MRCVHLDFHTSPDISGIGEAFDKKEFTRVVREAKIDLMTVFAKCHHGYSYYPTKVGTVHPHLKFNLLKEEIEAIHDAGAKAPIYITVGWSKKDADEHPEWHQIDFVTKKPIAPTVPEDPDAPLDECAWVALCPVGSYLDYLKAITREVCESFDVSDGIFYDICFVSDACLCAGCVAGMKKMGLNPESHEDARAYYVMRRTAMMKELTGIVHEYAKDAPVFYNGGADMNRTEYHPYQTHYELEDLPTAWGGYDQMPPRAKFFEKYGKFFLGMTGKFHHAWGEFGGFKHKDALRYECADMVSVGASISVGDHLHPSGKLDESTYHLLGYAFDYVEKIEKYSENTKAYTDLALWLSHNTDADMGASKMLQIMGLEYDIVEGGDSLDGYKAIILPDRVKLTDGDEAALGRFAEGGGKIIASYESVPTGLGVRKLAPSEYDQDFIKYDMPECFTPFLSYSSAYKTECEGEVLATVYEPYFSRTARHFCGHKNTPNKTECADYPALVRNASVLYFAHPVFSAFNTSGNYVLERYIARAIEGFYDRAIVTEGLPSSARARLRESEDGKFLALHLLYAPPVNRGNACMLVDFPALHSVKVTIKCDKPVTSARCVPSGEKIDVLRDGDRITLNIPPFSVHQLIVIE